MPACVSAPVIASHILELTNFAEPVDTLEMRQGFEQYQALAETGTTVADRVDLQRAWLAPDVSKGAFQGISETFRTVEECYHATSEVYTNAESWRNDILTVLNEEAEAHTCISDVVVAGAWAYRRKMGLPTYTVAAAAELAVRGAYDPSNHIVCIGDASGVATEIDVDGLFGASVHRATKRSRMWFDMSESSRARSQQRPSHLTTA